MNASQSYVIVGGGLAAASAAQTLREEGFDGQIIVLAGEQHLPYERPVLSKGYLLGEKELDSATVQPESWWREQDVDLRLGSRVVGLDTADRLIRTATRDEVAYDRLLIATGSRARRLEVPGADLDEVHVLRDREDAEAIRSALASRRPLVVVGAGWIGLEVAAAARAADCPVTVIEPAEQPLLRVMGPEVGELFADLHRSHGVDLRLGVGVTDILGEGGSVTAVRTDDGEQIDAGSVVVGIGADPQVDWALDAGLSGSDGIDVDAALRTSDPSVWAAGDVAAIDHPVLEGRVRVEHWANALNTGPAAARSMMDADVSYDRLPYFFTDQYDLGMEYVGHLEDAASAEVVLRGDTEALSYVAFWLVDAEVRAAMHVNQWDDGTDPLKALIGRRVAPDRLADTTIGLGDLADGS